ncbi:MAG: TetR-like C-terminal domain-containing protein [Blastococcus sp.]
MDELRWLLGSGRRRPTAGGPANRPLGQLCGRGDPEVALCGRHGITSGRSDRVARSVADYLGAPARRANRTLNGMLHEDRALFEAYRRGSLDRWAAAFAQVSRQCGRGEVSPSAGTSVAAEGVRGVVIHRWLIAGTPLNPDLGTAIVDDVMMSLLLRH